MELKDVILSTLSELQAAQEAPQSPIDPSGQKSSAPLSQEVPQAPTKTPAAPSAMQSDESDRAVQNLQRVVKKSESAMEDGGSDDGEKDEQLFLEHLRERLLVLFEGFQSPNNKEIEAKIDLTLNFLEYLLASIDERLDRFKR